MTQKQIEQTRVIAEWDGWEYLPPSISTPESDYLCKDGKMYPPDQLPYLTDLNALHPVAMDVLNSLRGIQYDQKQYYVSSIRSYCSTAPINGEYIDLFNAVYDGIVYLNSTK
jgi:hypothetical protein